MKRIMIYITILTGYIALCGCSKSVVFTDADITNPPTEVTQQIDETNKTEENDQDKNDQYKKDESEFGTVPSSGTRNNKPLSICDMQGNVVTVTEYYGTVYQLDDGLIYSKLADQDSNCFEYYYYVMETGENIKLGDVFDRGYEAYYASFVDENHFYMLLSTGTVFDSAKMKHYFCDVDLVDKNMEMYCLEDASAPYNTLTMWNEKVIILVQKKNGVSLEAFNPKNQSMNCMMNFEFDTNTNYGDVIRSICSNDEKLVMLRLHMEGEMNARLFVDIYENQEEGIMLVSSMDITDKMFEEDYDDFLKNMEIRQVVINFQYNHDRVFYKNFSSTTVFFQVNNDVSSSNVQSGESKFLINESRNKMCRNIYGTVDKTVVYRSNDTLVTVFDNETNMQFDYRVPVQNENTFITDLTSNSKGELILWLNDNGEEKVFYSSFNELLN